MGLCASNPEEDGNPQRAHAQQNPRQRQQRRGGRGGDVGQALERWQARVPRLTRAQLEKRRREFWESRVGGRMEMWQALHLAAGAVDDATARAIMQGAGLSPFDVDEAGEGTLTYDELGNRYVVPFIVLHTPRNLLSAQDVVDAPPSAAEQQRMEEEFTFKVRLSTGEADVVVEKLSGGATVARVKEIVHKERGHEPSSQRVLYRGAMLLDAQTVVRAGVENGCVFQVFVTRPKGGQQ